MDDDPLLSPQDQAEDLKAFERRLVEYVTSLGPQVKLWRVILTLTSVCAAVTAWGWAVDPHSAEAALVESLWNHKLFTLSCSLFVILVLLGAFKRVRTQQIMLDRCKYVLQDFNMSCDEKGRLILKPRPS